MFPAEYANRIFIAQHGSWNRSKKSGYRVIMVTLKDNKTVDKYGGIRRGLAGERARLGPAGGPAGACRTASLLISDDTADVVYRVTYSGNLALHRKDAKVAKKNDTNREKTVCSGRQ